MRAYLFIGQHGAERALEMFDELGKETALGRSEIARGRELLQNIRAQFQRDLSALDGGALVH